ncbi:hypothetical protein ABMA28_016459 [Loxostege sticticalis]|uniref:Uncharacterized protein n=1 Tax=Loxostege sticticalis TaxID=481309 RepID=A0ABD0T8Y5_LOXSC
MDSWLLVLILCCHKGFIVYASFEETGDVFEFGRDSPDTRIVFNEAGTIGIGREDKVKRIPIVVPYCMKWEYIRVEVDNDKGPPNVSFLPSIKTVVIKYRKNQYSKSQYQVTVKAKAIRNCPLFSDD